VELRVDVTLNDACDLPCGLMDSGVDPLVSATNDEPTHLAHNDCDRSSGLCHGYIK